MTNNIENRINSVVNQILNDVINEHDDAEGNGHTQLDKKAIEAILDEIQVVLFPAHFSSKKITDFGIKFDLGGAVERIYSSLADQITQALRYHEDYKSESEEVRREKAEELAALFLDKIPEIRNYLKTDLQAAFDGDPAAVNFDEIVYSYPGFYTIMINRIAHELYLLNVPLIPRIMTEHAHSKTGIDIHPGATLGKSFFIDHGTGVVIGETTIIGERVKVYQGVTLGGLSTRAGQGLKGVKRHPTIENDVTIYSNSSILGGETVIGEGSVIGGSCFITHSVAPNMRVSVQNPELLVKPAKKYINDSSQDWKYDKVPKDNSCTQCCRNRFDGKPEDCDMKKC